MQARGDHQLPPVDDLLPEAEEDEAAVRTALPERVRRVTFFMRASHGKGSGGQI